MGCSLEKEVIMLNSERVLNIRSIELTHYVLQAPPRNVWPSPPCRQSEALSGIISQDGRKQVGPKIELDMLGGSRLPWYKTIPKGCAPSYHCCAGRPENVHTQATSTNTQARQGCVDTIPFKKVAHQHLAEEHKHHMYSSTKFIEKYHHSLIGSLRSPVVPYKS